MKKVNLFLVKAFALVLFMGLNASAFAQNSIQGVVWEVTQQQDIQYTQKVITEDPQTTISFTQHQSTGEYEFYRTIMGNPNIQSVLLNSSYKVNDMFLLTIGNFKFLLFCGVFNGNVGFIAKANITTSFFTNPPQFDIFTVASSNSIDKIKAYLDANNQPQIVAIGTDNNNKSFFLHFDGATLVYEIYNVFNTNETMDDIEITKNFVVTTGRQMQNSSNIIVRVFDKNSIPNEYEYIFYLNYPTNNPVLCKTTINDNVAIMATTANNAQTHCFELNLTPALMTLLNSQWIDGYGNNSISIRDADFDYVDNHLIIVEQTPSLNYPNNDYAVIAWDIINSAPNVDIYYGLFNNDNYILNGITALDPNKNLFATVGIYPKSNEWLIWYGYRNTTGGNCNKSFTEFTNNLSLIMNTWVNAKQLLKVQINWITHRGSLGKYSNKII
jgi:hypothetical protein